MLALGLVHSRGPLGPALGFDRARVRRICCSPSEFSVKARWGIKGGRDVIPLSSSCLVRGRGLCTRVSMSCGGDVFAGLQIARKRVSSVNGTRNKTEEGSGVGGSLLALLGARTQYV
jgi:hypothetical protein